MYAMLGTILYEIVYKVGTNPLVCVRVCEGVVRVCEGVCGTGPSVWDRNSSSIKTQVYK